MSEVYYPPAGFHFRVQVLDLTPKGGAVSGENDISFQDASGLSVEMTPEEVAEGGENRFRHRLPVAAKYGDLVLKRGYVYPSLPLFQWCKATIQGGLAQRINTKTLTLQLLGPDPQNKCATEILRQWSFAHAWPTKWELSDFSSTKNDVLIETLHFAYRDFTAN